MCLVRSDHDLRDLFYLFPHAFWCLCYCAEQKVWSSSRKEEEEGKKMPKPQVFQSPAFCEEHAGVQGKWRNKDEWHPRLAQVRTTFKHGPNTYFLFYLSPHSFTLYYL